MSHARSQPRERITREPVTDPVPVQRDHVTYREAIDETHAVDAATNLFDSLFTQSQARTIESECATRDRHEVATDLLHADPADAAAIEDFEWRNLHPSAQKTE